MGNDTIIETDQIDVDSGFEQYKLPNGKVITIGKYDLDFFYKLQRLPAVTKIQMMAITVDEMQNYIDDQKASAKKKLLKLLKQEWRWRETGEEAFISAEMIPEVNMSFEKILKCCKSKKSLPLKDLEIIIDFFSGDKSEVYSPQTSL